MGQLKILKEQVERVLDEIPETRNNDKTLYIEIIKKYYSNFIITSPKGKQYIRIEKLLKLPSQGNVIRYRAYIQRSGSFLPTDEAVIRRRFKKEMAQSDFLKSLNYH